MSISDEITVDASIEELGNVMTFMDNFLESNACPLKEQTQLDIAMDEMFSNVAFYAYEEQPEDIPRKVTVILAASEDNTEFSIKLIDFGIPYNPLEKPDPDVDLPIEKRDIGGLGIFIVKNTMDKMFYERKNNQNILTMIKNVQE